MYKVLYGQHDIPNGGVGQQIVAFPSGAYLTDNTEVVRLSVCHVTQVTVSSYDFVKKST